MAKELSEVLKKHKLWLEGENGGERADLRGADLRCADLRHADLQGADLQGAEIEDDLLNALVPISCPEVGSFIAWKKVGNNIVKLEVCEDALRSSAFGRKCRCSKAFVLKIENIDGSDSGLDEISSDYNKSFVYKVGNVVEAKRFDTDRKNECAPGIHFFITRNEAVEY